MFFSFPSPSTTIAYEASAEPLLARTCSAPVDRPIDSRFGKAKERVRERSRNARRRLRDSSQSLVDHFKSVDGVYEVLTAGEKQRAGLRGADVGLCFGVRIPVMAGIRDRVMGLRRRTETAPERLVGEKWE